MLARDLDEGLGNLADSYSFHGFARKTLHQQPISGVTSRVSYMPQLVDLVPTLGVPGVVGVVDRLHTDRRASRRAGLRLLLATSTRRRSALQMVLI